MGWVSKGERRQACLAHSRCSALKGKRNSHLENQVLNTGSVHSVCISDKEFFFFLNLRSTITEKNKIKSARKCSAAANLLVPLPWFCHYFPQAFFTFFSLLNTGELKRDMLIQLATSRKEGGSPKFLSALQSNASLPRFSLPLNEVPI